MTGTDGISEGFHEEALGHLRTLTGRQDATFHDQQLEAIHRVVELRERVFVVQRTGWGKSAVYFIATRMLRDRGAGPTFLVSPLLALMRNQVLAAERMGIRAERIDSTNSDEWDQVVSDLDADRVDVLMVAPERLANEEFRTTTLTTVGRRVGLLVVDEAHCISDWGHDFRPDYRRIVRAVESMPPGVPIVGCTATANDRVVDDVDAQLGTRGSLRGPLRRDGLALHVLDVPEPARRLAWLAESIPRLGGSGIVYTLTVADAERVADWLRSRNIDAVAYHAGLDSERRTDVEARLLANEVDVVVATVALGMGFDKPDLHFVVHYQAPASAIAYYQQVGRAGRQLGSSVGVLLRGREDVDIQDFFIESAFPDPANATTIVSDLEANPSGFTLRELEERHNVQRKRLQHLLTTLHVEGAVERDGSVWRRTLRPWEYDHRRAEDVTGQRRVEQQEMVRYADTEGCRMSFLCQALDDPDRSPCGLCDNCTGRSLDVDLPRDLVAAAVEHLRSGFLVVEPRRQAPVGRTLPAGLRVEEGRALSRWGDGGWGGAVAEGRAAGRYPDDLVAALVALLDRWGPDPAPGWVTVVPSARHPTLLPDLARCLADAVGLRFAEVAERVEPRQPQKEMRNSATQFANVDGAFAVNGPVDDAPVLLLDDVVDSRWTLTVVGRALREAGSGPVHPLALADAAGRST